MGAIETSFIEAEDFLGGVSVFSPLESLFSEYESKKAAILKIGQFADENSGVMTYFFDGASVEGGLSAHSVRSFFNVDHAVRSLDAAMWSKAMSLTDCLEMMPVHRRMHWNNLIFSRRVERVDDRGVRVVGSNGRPVVDELPHFERDIVLPTIREMIGSRQKFLGERVSGLFHGLSGEHVTNLPSAFSGKMIITGLMGASGYRSDRVTGMIHDLRCVIAKFMGRDAPFARATDYALNQIIDAQEFGDWKVFDGGALRLKVFKKGSAHLHVHPEIAYRLNQVLAWMHPSAIPSQFRKKPSTPFKEFSLSNTVLPFSVLSVLEKMRMSYGTRNSKDGLKLFSDDYKPIPDDAAKVLEFLGGTPGPRGEWLFDYEINEVLVEVLRTGMIPEGKSHQFYPTRETLARELVDLAEIEEWHMVLEPSAGHGGIADYLPKDQLFCVEISPIHCKILEAKGFDVYCGDFLAWNPGFKVDRVCMNPPFADGRAVLHVQHAARLMTKNGRLVAILPASLKGKTLVDGMDHQWGAIKNDQFAGTSVSVVTLVLTSCE